MVEKRTKKEKIELLKEHFFYEITNLSQILEYADQLSQEGKTEQFFKNIIIDSFLLHARNLFEFFYYDGDKKDYARASHFLDSTKDWTKLRPDETTWLNKLKKRINSEVSHLTYNRISGTPPEKYWRLNILYSDFVDIVKIFLENISKEYVSEPIMRLKKELKV